MTAHVYGPRRRKHNVVGHIGPEKPWQRASRLRYEQRIPLADWIDDAKANALRTLALAPVHVPKHAWRHRDHWIMPAGVVLTLMPTLLFLSAIQPYHLLPRFPEIVGCMAATGVCCWYFCQDHAAAINERVVRAMQADIDARVNGLTCVAVQKRDHATTAICTVNWGHEPGQYEDQLGKLVNSFRSPVFITNESPGRLELRIQHEDLLAQSAIWTPLEDGRPDRIPFGHDWDDRQVTLNLLYASLLIAGVRGSGKSAALNALIAHLVSMRWVELYIIDPLEGVDLGCWWPFAQEVAETEEAGVKLVEHFEDLRASRVREMRHGSRPVQQARYCARWPMRVLVIDEVASLSLRGTRNDRTKFAETVHSIASKGRKSDDCLVMATQHPSVDVIPQLIRGQMTRVLGLRMARREQGRQVFGDGVVADWDLSKIPIDHPGQGVFYDGSTYTMLRTPGLYGPALRRRVHELDQIRKANLAGPDDEPRTTWDAERAGEKEGLASSDGLGPDGRVAALLAALPADRSIVDWPTLESKLTPKPFSRSTLRRWVDSKPGLVQKVGHNQYRRAA